jgi:hypothetical protein
LPPSEITGRKNEASICCFVRCQELITEEGPLDPLAAERQFFNALLGARWESLDQVLGDDFLLTAVMSGSEVTKPVLLDAVASGNLRFESIDVLESKLCP